MKTTFAAILLPLLLVIASPRQLQAVSYEFIPVYKAGGLFPAISLGRVAMQITTHSDPPYDDFIESIITGDGGPVSTIITAFDPAPWGTFISFNNRTSIKAGTVAFTGHDHDILRGGGGRSGIFTSNGGPLTTIAQTGDPAPIGTLYGVGDAFLGSAGVAFLATYNWAGDGSVNHAIFVGNGGPLTTIAKAGDPAPITTFDLLSYYDIDSDAVAFLGYYGTRDNGGNGIFTGNGGPLTTIAKGGDPAPIGTFQSFNSGRGLSIHDNTVAFVAQYGENPGTLSEGIFTGNGGSLTTIVQSGDPAPVGTFSDRFCWSFSGPAINRDTVAFLADYNVYRSGSFDIFTRGLFTSQAGILSQVIATGDPLFGSTIKDLYSFDLDEIGNLVFSYALADGRGGTAIAHPIPEPGAAVLLFTVTACMAAMSRRRTLVGYVVGNVSVSNQGTTTFLGYCSAALAMLAP